jgi:hypothetical protein
MELKLTTAFQSSMSLGRQFISCYLALCFAFAGAVGLSPVLHHLIEHGGKGTAHTHVGFTPPAVSAGHHHHHAHSHRNSHQPAEPHAANWFTHSHKPFEFPKISLSRLGQALKHLLERNPPLNSGSSPTDDDPEHEHHSLPQLLASGLIDQHLDSPLVQVAELAPTFLNVPCHGVPAVRDWDAQSASRAPPFARS